MTIPSIYTIFKICTPFLYKTFLNPFSSIFTRIILIHKSRALAKSPSYRGSKICDEKPLARSPDRSREGFDIF